MIWHCKQFADLNTFELFEIYKNRVDVFVVEQHCAYAEIDGADLTAHHLFAKQEGRITAYCRIIELKGRVKIGRVLVARHARGSGLAKELMRRALAHCTAQWRGLPVALQAQAYLRGFYASFGFEAVSAEYEEDGITHVDMELHPR